LGPDLGLRLGLLGHLEPGFLEDLGAELSRRARDTGVLREQGEQRGVARGDLRELGREPVEPLELALTSRVAARLVGLDAGLLLAAGQGDRLELRAHSGARGRAPHGVVDLPGDVGQDGDEPFLVAGSAWAARLRALAASCHFSSFARTAGAGRRELSRLSYAGCAHAAHHRACHGRASACSTRGRSPATRGPPSPATHVRESSPTTGRTATAVTEAPQAYRPPGPRAPPGEELVRMKLWARVDRGPRRSTT